MIINPAMNYAVITLFPEMFQAFSDYGVSARALKKKLISLKLWNLRDFTTDNYQTIDDRPFGGGPGMVMLYEPIAKAIKAAQEYFSNQAKVIYLSPQGKAFKQQQACELREQSRPLILLCGRYEGIDERVIDEFVDMEISIGDFVLSGGEIPAIILMDAITRLIPDVLGHQDSAKEDSFFDGLLDCPHYTRPAILANGLAVPEILVSGHHANIAKWRRSQKLGRTFERRPELISRQCLSDNDTQLLDEYRYNKKIDTRNKE